ncbi:hypothetical protein LOTGIDRAFT_221919 [Lottia gigantea]|uniref:BTB domain-containing protein n=1 Tax=Lottia gigantea TaxID=225164 RepID=V3Z2F9_LOTGI|nr:hypothetical protein LOTGIDRAFT_221919 [Lottia gigantea]ESO84793.1 hypothetical protein LOTGIDRAFT_221919 [Lottia gigantea]
MGNSNTAPIDRKRKLEEVEGENSSDSSDSSPLHIPKKKRTKSTSKYIFQTLFINGENSDITIKAIGKDWNLHKHYLCQCGYFNSMFNGKWLESELTEIEVDILDKNIDEKALKIAFGSLYTDDIMVKPVEVVGVLASATFLQLEGLIQYCHTLMKESISTDIVVEYYEIAHQYGLMDIKKLSFDWLLHNLMSPTNFKLLKNISCELMIQLISHPDLFVLQVEMDVYSLLRKWIFLKNNPAWDGTCKELLVEVDNFFKKFYKEKKLCYLECIEGKEYIPVFQHVRWQHVINENSALKAIKTECVLPEYWLDPFYKHQWFYRLQSEQSIDKGPTAVDEELFYKECSRNGRVLLKRGEYCWRWVGYNYGVDLLLSYVNGMIIITRNCSNSASGSIGLQNTRNIMLRLTAVNLDKNGCVEKSKSTELTLLSLSRDEECVLLRVDTDQIFPLVIILNVLVYTPLPDYPNPELSIPTLLSIDHSDVAVQTIGLHESPSKSELQT